jgi:hypothetical protein
MNSGNSFFTRSRVLNNNQLKLVVIEIIIKTLKGNLQGLDRVKDGLLKDLLPKV